MLSESWKYHNPVEIIFGAGSLDNLPKLIGDRDTVLITTPGSTKRGTTDVVSRHLGSSLVAVLDETNSYPTFDTIEDDWNKIAQYDYEMIIALGGGSAIDTAKLIAATKAAGDARWLLRHVKEGHPFPEASLSASILAIPTTAGTGSEVTMWATLWDFHERKKYSVSHPSLYPRRALLDPELTMTLPEQETVHGGLDALSHAMEAIWNKNHNPVSDAFALEAIASIIENLPALRREPQNLALRSALLCASLCAGMAFSATRTALAHSISYPLTAHLGLSHGLACALPLPLLIEFNGTHDFDRIKIMAKPLKAHMSPASMQERLHGFFAELGIVYGLRNYGVDERTADVIAESAYTPERADNNIRAIHRNDLRKLVRKLL